jgi:hypothetical protein
MNQINTSTTENIIYDPNDTFDFTKLSLAYPTAIQGGSYFTKILHHNKPLYIETPKSLTKQGFVKNGKKMYTELMFNNSDEDFIHWIENLESTCQELIYEKGDTWFQTKLELTDIETAFTSPMRIYKSGKFYLIRVNVKMNYSTNYPQIKIYSENETPLTIDDVVVDTHIVSIVEVQGIKFTSRSFQIELEVKQVMVLNTDKIFENCLIRSVVGKKTPSMNQPLAISNEETVESTESNETLTTAAIDTTIENNVEDTIVVTSSNNEGVSDPLENIVKSQTVSTDESLAFLEQLSNSIVNNERSSVDNKIEPVSKKITPTTITVNTDELNIEDLTEPIKTNNLEEVDINSTIDSLETITLKKPNQVYYEIYRQARKKAKQSKRDAIVAFLEAKNIKKTYMLDDLDESDSEDSDLDNLSQEDDDEDDYDEDDNDDENE